MYLQYLSFLFSNLKDPSINYASQDYATKIYIYVYLSIPQKWGILCC